MIINDHHVHLHGCISAEMLWQIGKDTYTKRAEMLNWYADHFANSFGYRPDYLRYWQDQDGFLQFAKDYLVDGPVTFKQFQAKFNLIIALCPISTEDFNIQESIIRSVAGQGLKYFEARTIIPMRFDALQAGQYLKRLCHLVDRLNDELDMKTELVFSLFRDNETALSHYRWLRGFIDQEPHLGTLIVGIDFAGEEEGFAPQDKQKLFEIFLADNLTKQKLHLLYHVGESFVDKGMHSAIRWIWEAHELGASRLGHATALGLCPEALRGRIINEAVETYQETERWLLANLDILKEHGYLGRPMARSPLITYDDNTIEDIKSLQKAVASILRSKNAVIESCPTSNWRISQITDLNHHPLRFFSQQRMQVLLGTDDPGIFAIDWQSEALFASRILSSKKTTQGVIAP